MNSLVYPNMGMEINGIEDKRQNVSLCVMTMHVYTCTHVHYLQSVQVVNVRKHLYVYVQYYSTVIYFIYVCSVSMKLVTFWTPSCQPLLGRATAVPMGSWSPYSCSQSWRRSYSASLHQIGNNSCRRHGGIGYWWVKCLLLLLLLLLYLSLSLSLSLTCICTSLLLLSLSTSLPPSHHWFNFLLCRVVKGM